MDERDRARRRLQRARSLPSRDWEFCGLSEHARPHTSACRGRRAGGGGPSDVAARAAVGAAIGLTLSWRYREGRVGRHRIAREGTAHLLVVAIE